MSAHDTKSDYRIPESGFWAGAWRYPAVLSVVGLVLAVIGHQSDPERIGYSYLFAVLCVLTLMFGGMFLVLIQHFTAGYWGVTTRRIAEVIMASAPVVALLVLPILGGAMTGHLNMYDEWMDVGGHDEGHGDHGEAAEGEGEPHGAVLLGASTASAQEHGEAHEGEAHEGEAHEGEAHAHTPQETRLHHEVLAHKAPYLGKTRWLVSGLAYLLIWIAIAVFWFRTSVKQDETKDLQLTNLMKKYTPLACILFALTLTFASFDWVMSLMPAWYSTIYGVVIFGGSATAVLAVMILISISLYENGLVGEAINREHIHDLGKLMFGFMAFWTYASFSQWMLIWYASIPEEIAYYQLRYHGGWIAVAYILVLGGFAIPFVAIMSRVVKRNLRAMKFWATWLVAMHCVDMFWHVLPHAPGSAGLTVTAGDIGCLLFTGGVFFTFVFAMLKRQALIPVGDPRLGRCLHHHQSH